MPRVIDIVRAEVRAALPDAIRDSFNGHFEGLTKRIVRAEIALQIPEIAKSWLAGQSAQTQHLADSIEQSLDAIQANSERYDRLLDKVVEGQTESAAQMATLAAQIKSLNTNVGRLMQRTFFSTGSQMSLDSSMSEHGRRILELEDAEKSRQADSTRSQAADIQGRWNYRSALINAGGVLLAALVSALLSFALFWHFNEDEPPDERRQETREEVLQRTAPPVPVAPSIISSD